MWIFKWILIPVGAAALLVAGAVEIGPSLSAADGHGTVGYFVPEVEHCSNLGCGWSGNFVLPDGRVTRRNVTFLGPQGAMYQGDRVPALDTGGPGEVYPSRGPRTWIGDLVGIIVGALGFVLWTWRVPFRIIRRRLRTSDFLIPDS